MLGDLGSALLYIAQPWPFFFVLLGTSLGVFVGAIPGLTGGMLIPLVMPLTFYMDSTLALVMMVAMYVGSVSGGLISATLYVILTYHTPWQWLFLLAVPLFLNNGFTVWRQEGAALDPMLRQLSLSSLLFVILFGVGQLL